MRRLALLGVVAMLAATPMAARAGDGIDLGTIVGAGLGGVIGNQIGKGTGKTVATVAGVILGGVAGHHVDRSWNGAAAMQRRTVSYYQPAPVYSGYLPNYVAPYAPPPTIIHSEYYEERYRPYRSGHGHGYGKGNWRHEDPAWQRPVVRQVVRIESGAVLRVAAHAVAPERYCREYTNRVVVGGRVQESYGNACMQPDGSWQVVD